jgi:hypothetical protein
MTLPRRCALAYSAIALGASFFLFAAGFQVFNLGLWIQSEPAILALFISGACCALGLAALALLREPVGHIFRHPLIVTLGALTLWSGLAALNAPLPIRSWFGAPETGQGALSLLVLTVNTGLALVLWRHRRLRAALLISASVAIAALTLLNIVASEGSPWRPGAWAEYQAYIGFFMLLALLCVPGRKRRASAWAVMALVAIMTVILSKNRSAIALLGWAPVLCWFIRRMQSKWMARPKAGREAASAGAGLKLILTAGPLRTGLAGFAVLSPVIIAFGLAAIATMTGQFSSWSRFMFYKVALARLASEPGLLFSGAGWGSYNDTLFAYTFIPGVNNYEGTLWQPTNWEGMTGGAFHVHNEAIELILAIGLPGAALAAALAATLLCCAPLRRFAAIAALWITTFGLAGAWFMLPACLPFAALAMAATVASPRRTAPAETNRNWRFAIAAIVAAALLSIGAVIQFKVARQNQALLVAVQQNAPTTPPTRLYQDSGRGGNHLWWVALNFRNHLDNLTQTKQAITPDQVRWLLYLIEAIDEQTTSGNAGLRLRALGVELRNDLATRLSEPVFDAVRAAALPLWQMRLGELLALAPRRSELAIPFFTLLVNAGNDAATLALADDILRRNAQDPVGLWFSGLVHAKSKLEERQGLDQLARALDHGIGRFLPVDANFRAELGRAAARVSTGPNSVQSR